MIYPWACAVLSWSRLWHITVCRNEEVEGLAPSFSSFVLTLCSQVQPSGQHLVQAYIT